jgi:hypothetical protein
VAETAPIFLLDLNLITIRENNTLRYIFPPIQAFNGDSTSISIISTMPTFITQEMTILYINPKIGDHGDYSLSVVISDDVYADLTTSYTL